MKMPLDFGVKLFFRLLLPGFFIAIGAWPLVGAIIEAAGFTDYVEGAFLALVIVAGWFVVASDMPCYMLLEGRRFWPAWLWRIRHRIQQRRLENLEAVVDDYYSQSSPDEGARRRWLEASVEKRQFPMDDAGKYSANHPTRLGNLIAAFEGYAQSRYGVEAIFYWPRIWINLDKDLRDELDGRQAMADSAVYSTVFLGLAAVLWSGYGVVELIVGTVGPGAAGRLAPVLAWARAITGNTPAASGCFLLAAVFLAGSAAVYRLALFTNAQFGVLFKAVIDTHVRRLEDDYMAVGRIAEQVAALCGLDKPRGAERFDVARRYLQYMNVKVPGQRRALPIGIAIDRAAADMPAVPREP